MFQSIAIVVVWLLVGAWWDALGPQPPDHDPVVGTWVVVDLQSTVSRIDRVPPGYESSWPTVDTYKAWVVKQLDGAAFVVGTRRPRDPLWDAETTTFDLDVRGKRQRAGGTWGPIPGQPKAYWLSARGFLIPWGVRLDLEDGDTAKINYPVAYNENVQPPKIRVTVRKTKPQAKGGENR